MFRQRALHGPHLTDHLKKLSLGSEKSLIRNGGSGYGGGRNHGSPSSWFQMWRSAWMGTKKTTVPTINLELTTWTGKKKSTTSVIHIWFIDGEVDDGETMIVGFGSFPNQLASLSGFKYLRR